MPKNSEIFVQQRLRCLFTSYRKGAPFLHRIDEVKQWLLEAGLVNYWLGDLIQASAQEARMKQNVAAGTEQVCVLKRELYNLPWEVLFSLHIYRRNRY